jgi:hypothetical protein
VTAVKQLTYADLIRGVPTVNGARRKLGHPLPADECSCLRAPIADLLERRCCKCGRILEALAA